jgi:transketolase
VLSRQKVPVYERPKSFAIRDVWRGGYVLADAEGGSPQITLIATGSEVEGAMAARAELMKKGRKVRVVSMPCYERFRVQSADYRASVLAPTSRRVVVEAGRTDPWWQIAGEDGLVIGLDHFGASAPGEVLVDKLGFTGARIAARIEGWMMGTDTTLTSG